MPAASDVIHAVFYIIIHHQHYSWIYNVVHALFSYKFELHNYY